MYMKYKIRLTYNLTQHIEHFRPLSNPHHPNPHLPKTVRTPNPTECGSLKPARLVLNHRWKSGFDPLSADKSVALPAVFGSAATL
jgi:hypothetical protein